jgi:hypothetical protein
MKNILPQLKDMIAPEESDFEGIDDYHTAVLEYEEKKQGILDGFVENVWKSKTVCDLHDRKAEAKLIQSKFNL